MKKGSLYGIGTGTGNETITLEGQRYLKEAEVIALTQTNFSKDMNLNAIKGIVDISGKEILEVSFPMDKGEKEKEKAFKETAEKYCNILDSGKNIAMPLPGDLSVYSVFPLITKYIPQPPYNVKYISGIPSFIIAANLFGDSLINGDQSLMILSASDPCLEQKLQYEGAKVILKIGNKMNAVISLLDKLNLTDKAEGAANIGMSEQKLYKDIHNIDKDKSYFSLILVRA